MGARHLSERENWQHGANLNGKAAEKELAKTLAPHMPGYNISVPPKLQVYSNGRGVILDLMIKNISNGRRIYIEKKNGNNGGNAHERVYKFQSPGLIERTRQIDPKAVDTPYFFVFSGKTFHNEKYQNEFKVTFKGQENLYAIASDGFKNADKIASMIKEILK